MKTASKIGLTKKELENKIAELESKLDDLTIQLEVKSTATQKSVEMKPSQEKHAEVTKPKEVLPKGFKTISITALSPTQKSSTPLDSSWGSLSSGFKPSADSSREYSEGSRLGFGVRVLAHIIIPILFGIAISSATGILVGVISLFTFFFVITPITQYSTSYYLFAITIVSLIAISGYTINGYFMLIIFPTIVVFMLYRRTINRPYKKSESYVDQQYVLYAYSCCTLCLKHPISKKYHLQKAHNLKNVDIKNYFTNCGCGNCNIYNPPFNE